MGERAHAALLAEYNEWMNDKIYAAAARLPQQALAEDRGAFFGSILGTLNHIVAGDTIWLQRFAKHGAGFEALREVAAMPAPAGLEAQFSTDLAQLAVHRRRLDTIIRQWAAQLEDADLDVRLTWANTKGIVSQKRFGSLVLHFFNHQTHHRGQVSTLLSQAGEDIGVTDLLMLISNEFDPA